MKHIFKIFIMIITLILVYFYRDDISTFIIDNIIYKGSNDVLTYNEYYIDTDYLYVQNIDTDEVNNKQEILNMFYSIVNSGDDSFTFKCNYDTCIDDVNNLINNDVEVTSINNFVHPYNSFTSINIDVNSNGRITVTNKKVYDNNQITIIDEKINQFINEQLNNAMSDYDKIKAFHDYIINNTVYDDSNKTYTAYDLFTIGKSICGGYSDAMSIFLNKLNIKNYKITSENHVWNFVFLDNAWYHIDATWDDPVASDGNQYLIHNFFMLKTNELLELDKVEHNFDKNIFREAV